MILRDLGRFGAEITGLPVGVELSKSDLLFLATALYRSKFLVIKDQRLTQDQLVAFCCRWGAPIPHVLRKLRSKDHPCVTLLGNSPDADPDGSQRNRATYWHTDKSYETRIAAATFLYSKKTPRRGGNTLIADMVAAYRALPERKKERISRLQGMHVYGAPGDEKRTLNSIHTRSLRAKRPAIHPLVMRHPCTGEPALYGITTVYSIRGLNDRESRDLINALREHALRPEFIVDHKHSVGDLMLWDNILTLHCATPIGPPTGSNGTRLLYRVSTRGHSLELPLYDRTGCGLLMTADELTG